MSFRDNLGPPRTYIWLRGTDSYGRFVQKHNQVDARQDAKDSTLRLLRKYGSDCSVHWMTFWDWFVRHWIRQKKLHWKELAGFYKDCVPLLLPELLYQWGLEKTNNVKKAISGISRQIQMVATILVVPIMVIRYFLLRWIVQIYVCHGFVVM